MVAPSPNDAHPPPPANQSTKAKPHRRPADLLPLQPATRVALPISNTEAAFNPTHPKQHFPSLEAPILAPKQPTTTTLPQNMKYTIPQKRIPQLQPEHDHSVNSVTFYWPRDGHNNIAAQTTTMRVPVPAGDFGEGKGKEKVIGGLTLDEQLKQIWSKSDEEDVRELRRLRKGSGSGWVVVEKGNEVLGEWLEEERLKDWLWEEGERNDWTE